MRDDAEENEVRPPAQCRLLAVGFPYPAWQIFQLLLIKPPPPLWTEAVALKQAVICPAPKRDLAHSKEDSGLVERKQLFPSLSSFRPSQLSPELAVRPHRSTAPDIVAVLILCKATQVKRLISLPAYPMLIINALLCRA